MATDLRTDDSHNVSYPQSPDTRGSARIYHLRKPYYLGSHDSPLSYVMFGIWKHYLTTQGTPPATATIREQAESVLGVQPEAKKPWKQRLIMGAALTLTLVIGALAGANFRSTQDSNHVDGIALSANEIGYIRSVREADASWAAKMANRTHDPETAMALIKGTVSRDEVLKRIRGK
jgi:hypothetical protein